MSDEEMVTVKVTATQRVEYIQYRQIPKSRYEQYEAMCDVAAPEWEFDREFENLIDVSQVCDAGELQDVTLEAVDSITGVVPDAQKTL